MANILDEQERKRKELAAQGIHTRGVAGAQGGAAEVGYVPPSRRNAPINQIPPQNASPQADYARSAEGGAMIPPDKAWKARMLGSMPNQGSLIPFEQPADAWIQRSRDFTQSRVGGTNQQLQMHRQEMGTNQGTSLTQMASQLDPSIKRDAERARQWRLMTPQQRRAEVDRLALEQDMRTADSVASQDGIAKYGRDLADPTGTFIDSYGRSNAIYSPETQIRIREHQRKIESQAADMFSSYDRTKWATEKDMYQAVASLPAVQEAGEFGKAIAFNIVRKYASPEMKAKMEAEDRNLDVFKRTFKSITDQEIDQMQQEMGGEYTNMGNEEFAKQIYMNKDDNFRANSLVERVLERAGVRYTVENGRVVPDQGWAAQAKMREEERKARDAEISSELAIIRKREEAFRQIDRIREINPERAAKMDVDDAGNLVDYSKYAPVPEAPPRELTARERIGRVKTRADANKITSEITSAAKAVQGLIPEGSEGENLVELVDAKIAELEELNSSGEMKEDGGSYEADITDLKNARDTFIQYGSDLMSLSDVIIELENARTLL